MWGLVVACGICGLLFGRYFTVYSLIGAEPVLAGIAYFFGKPTGLDDRRALLRASHGCPAAVLCPFGGGQYLHG